MSSAASVKTSESALDSRELSFLPHQVTQGAALAVAGRHLLMFGSLYFAQGAMVAYFSNFQKPYLSSVGINANTIGILSGLVLLPFILKIGMGLISDRVNLLGFGYRKPYILLGLTVSITMLAVASVVKPQLNLTLFASLVFLASVGMALFDTATDGLAVDVSNPKWHGAVQASMVAGRAVGLIVISWSCGLLAERQNYSSILLVIALCLLVPLFLIVQFREPLAHVKRKTFLGPALRKLLTPKMLVFCAYIFLATLIMWGGINDLVAFYMSRDLHASPAQLGTYGALVGVGAIMGAFVGGRALDRWSKKHAAYIAVFLISIAAVLIGLTTRISSMYVLAVFWGIAFGFQQTVLVALAMRLTDVRASASMFTILMTIANLGLTVGEGVTTSLTDDISFSVIFWLLSAVNLLLIFGLWILFKLMRSDKSLA